MRRFRLFSALPVAAAVGSASFTPSCAGTHSTTQQRLDSLEQRVRRLEEQQLRSSSSALLVVGCGRLGSLVGKGWPAGSVTALTRTEAKHASLRELGFEAMTSSQLLAMDEHDRPSWPFVLFSVPPRGNPDYALEVRKATQLWDGTGSFVFTSSGSVFAESSGGICNESSPVGSSARAERLLGAEEEALSAGGCVVRLAGLYDKDHGPHAFWMRTRP